jgi:nucleotide-binding universal stress UspA family protein
MFKHILVPACGAASDAAVFATALLAARPAGAHLEFLHVKPDVTDMLMAMTSGGLGGGAVVQEVIDRMDAEANATERKVWEAFGAFCHDQNISTDATATGISAELVVETGSETQWLADHGRFADLIVVGSQRDGRESEIDLLEAALLDTGRPLLIAPTVPPTVLPGIVAIAWKDTPEAARAVTAALSFIDAAERVVIFSVTEDGTANDASADRLARSLRWHNRKTEVVHLTADARSPVEQLLAAATALPAGLLVMGGYSHSRLREVVFGGFTQHVLRQPSLPVLMAH